MTTAAAETFTPGMRVVLARVRNERYLGAVGTVKKVIKSRGVVWVDLDDGRQYDAVPDRLDVQS
jgi:hypothetical protein